MASYILLENGTDRMLLEDGVSLILNEDPPAAPVPDTSPVYSSTTAGTAASFNYTVPAGSNTYLRVVVVAQGNNTSTVTYNGVSMSLVSRVNITVGVDVRVEVWELVAPAAGTHAVVVTPSSATAANKTFVAESFTGVDQTTPRGSAVTNLGNGVSFTSTSVTVPVAAGDLAVDAMTSYNQAMTENGGQTAPVKNNTLSPNIAVSNKAAAGSSVAMGWTWGGAMVTAQIGYALHGVSGAPTSVTQNETVAVADASTDAGTLSTVNESVSVADSPSAQTSVTNGETVAVSEAQAESGLLTAAQTVAVTEGQSNASTLATVNETPAVADAGAFSTNETQGETITAADNAALAGGSTNAESIALTEGNSAAGASTQAQTVAAADALASAGSMTSNEAVSVSEGVGFAAASVNAENPAVSESQAASAALSAVADQIAVTDAESHATGTSSSDVNENQGVTVSESAAFASAGSFAESVAVSDAGVFATSIAAGNEAVSVGEGFAFEAVWVGLDEPLSVADGVINLGLIDAAEAVTVFDDYQTVSQVNVFSNGYLRTATSETTGLTAATAHAIATDTRLGGIASTGTRNSITTTTNAVIIELRSTA